MSTTYECGAEPCKVVSCGVLTLIHVDSCRSLFVDGFDYRVGVLLKVAGAERPCA